jgi:hypothetical protein
MAKRSPQNDPELRRLVGELAQRWFKKAFLLDIALNGKPRSGRLRKTKNARGRTAPKTHHKPAGRPLEAVVRLMLASARDPKNPSLNEQAAQALKEYTQKRAADIRSTPTRVAAGVKAVVTKRRMKA